MSENPNEFPQPKSNSTPVIEQTLSELLSGFPIKWNTPKWNTPDEVPPITVSGISMDSNEIQPGWLFVAVPGSHSHGAKYAAIAEQAGAAAILTDMDGAKLASSATIPVAIIENPRKHVGLIAAKFYQDALQDIEKKVAVTGTNGKTTTSYFVRAALQTKYKQVGLMGTVEIDTGSRQKTSFCTTPEAPVVYRYLNEMAANGVHAAVLETSSHSFSYNRVNGLTFDIGIFTNLQHDHLDYYGSMDNYFVAKAELFTPQYSRRGVVCIDDAWGLKLSEIASVPVDTVAVLTENQPEKMDSHWFVTDIEPQMATGGVAFVLHSPDGAKHSATSPLPGIVNVQNAALAIVAASKMGISIETAIAGIRNCQPIPGRATWIESDPTCQPKCMVDYAHTPEAVTRILETIRPYTKGRIFHVFGTDGDRDASKREEVAENAAKLADVLWITDENPRWEDPQEIRDYLIRGAKKVRPDLKDVHEIKTSRKEAIITAIQEATVGDVVLISGKGAEACQEIKGVRYDYSDLEVASEAIKNSLNLHQEKLITAKEQDLKATPIAQQEGLESTSEDEARAKAMRELLNQYGLEADDWDLLDQDLEESDFLEPTETKPVVAIVGRPNVGKSTLVNRILGRREAVVQDVPGVTRDRVMYDASWNGTDFVLVDTGGWEVDTKGLDKRVADQSELAVQMANVVVMVVDATVGVTATDERALEMLRRSKKPIVLSANKVDSTSQEADAAYLWSLGLGEPYPVSALHGRGTGDLLDAVLQKVHENESVGVERYPAGVRRVALVGRPNVGKSSLLNALAGENRAVVHDLAGTTRDPVDEMIELDGERWLFVDTAGVKRKLHRTSGADYYATLRTAAQIEQAEVALVLVDASVPMVDQDLRVMQQVIDAGRAMVIVNNKWDLVDAQRQADLRREQAKELERMTWAPRINLSALTTWHTNRISRALHQALDGWDTRIPTAKLNSFLGKLVAAHPHPVRGGKQSRILFATQAAARPPRFVLFTTGFLEAPYLRFIERRLREEFGFVGTPIQFSVRIRERKRR